MKKILIIEDDLGLLTTVTTALEAENFRVISATDGKHGLELAIQQLADLIVLDWGLPSLNGSEICRSLRSRNINTPIIMLTGKKMNEIDKVLGLEIGADDYVVKPFGIRELVARIRAILRRIQVKDTKMEEYKFGEVYINFKKKVVYKGKNKVHFTAKEFGLLNLLISHEGEVISRDTILNEVWGYDRYPNTRTVDTFVHNIRKKIEENPSEPSHIITVHSTGYRFIK